MSRRILLADDEAIDRLVTKRSLEAAGFEVIEAVDGLQAMAHLMAPGGARVAVLDWNMPGLDGPEICRRVRTTPALESLYLILLTGCRLEIRHAVVGLDAGADDYLRKPVVPAELVARVNVGLRVTRLQDRLAAQMQELQQAGARIQQLHALLPMCCVCKRVRTDRDYWQQLESYLAQHSGVRVTHGYCPACYAEAVGQLAAQG
jgi:DNA-binding response OmpR family regulator